MADSLARRGSNGGAGPRGDATQSLMYDFLARHEEIVERRQALNKQKRELIKEIEKAGIPKEAWQHFISTRAQAGVIRERIDAAWRQLMMWDAKPVGVQSGMDLTQTEVGEPNVHELKRIDHEGLQAGKAGRKRESNPYTPGTEAAARWDQAWLRGQSEIAAEMGPQPARRGRGRPPGSKNRPRPDLTVHEGGGEEPDRPLEDEVVGADDTVH